MQNEAEIRWNRRYQDEERYNSFTAPRSFLENNASYLPVEGLALDAAMGLGGNAAFLLEHGLKVVGVDISGVAVRRTKARLPSLMAVQADLATFFLPQETFDVILNFFYLERQIWPVYEMALRPGGILFFETMTVEMQKLRPDIDPIYLLQPGELAAAFPGLETLVYEEGWTAGRSGHQRVTARLIARKPAVP